MEVSSGDVKKYQSEFEKKSKYKILQGVVRRAGILNVSVNQNVINNLPHKFNHALEEEVTATDQNYSGRCWIFAALNVMRHKLIAKYKLKPDFQLSQSFVARWDKLEKCNVALELIYDLAKNGMRNTSLEYTALIPNTLSDGGTWGMFVEMVKKYGLVPQEIYPENAQTMSTARLNNMLITTVMKSSDVITSKMSLKEFREYKKTVLEECYRIINICMGNAPEKFLWSWKDKTTEKEYTPKSFYSDVVKPLVDVEKYVSLANFPLEDYKQTLGVEYMTNVYYEGDDVKRTLTNTYLNVDIDTFKNAVFNCILKGTGVWFACDIGQYYLNRGTVLDKNASNLKEMFDIDFSLSKRASLETRTSLPNHAMTFIGAHKEKSGTIKRWKVENSHGDDGALKGFITMSDSWFNEYVICAAVPVDCIPVALRDEAMKKKKVKWLPFYSPLGTYSS